MYLKIQNGQSTKQYTLTDNCAKPYINVGNQSRLPLTTSTTSGLQLKVNVNGIGLCRGMEYQSESASATYLTSAVNSNGLSNTTALTRQSTSSTSYLTRPSTSGESYITRPSTSGTSYLTSAGGKYLSVLSSATAYSYETYLQYYGSGSTYCTYSFSGTLSTFTKSGAYHYYESVYYTTDYELTATLDTLFTRFLSGTSSNGNSSSSWSYTQGINYTYSSTWGEYTSWNYSTSVPNTHLYFPGNNAWSYVPNNGTTSYSGWANGGYNSRWQVTLAGNLTSSPNSVTFSVFSIYTDEDRWTNVSWLRYTYADQAVTTGTVPLTKASTYSTSYLTRPSTSQTSYLTRPSTSGYTGVSSSSSSSMGWR